MYEWVAYHGDVNTKCGTGRTVILLPARPGLIDTAFILSRQIPHNLYVQLLCIVREQTKDRGTLLYMGDDALAELLTSITRAFFKENEGIWFPLVV